MEYHDARIETAQRQPAATATRHPTEVTTAPSTLKESPAPHPVMRAHIDRSPRMLAQRRTLQAVFGSAFQPKDALEDEKLQARMGSGGPLAAPAASAKAPLSGTGIPNPLKAGIESLSGMDLSDVRVHRNSGKPAQLNAMAYAQGNDIHLAPGQEQHLPHEAWHVVQQRQGRVASTLEMAGMAINDEPALERDADEMGRRASTMQMRHNTTADVTGASIVTRHADYKQGIEDHQGYLEGRDRPGETVQRKVSWEDQFHDYNGNPPVEDEKFELAHWMDTQAARELYTAADASVQDSFGSLLDVFDQEPQVLLVITTNPNINAAHFGDTSLEFQDGTNPPVAVSSNNGPQWMPLAAAGKTAIITVAIAMGENAAQTAHTLNHEMAMHATRFLDFVRSVRANPSQDIGALADSLLGIHHLHHADIHKPDSRINATHDAMLAKAEMGDREALIDAYYDDKSLYDPQGHTMEQPRQGHGDQDPPWIMPRVGAGSPLKGLVIGNERTVEFNRNRMRVKRLDKSHYHVWCASNQVLPYKVLVSEPDD